MGGYKILVTDDEPDFITVLSCRLASRGYKVISAADGNECIEQAKRHSPDMIILDIMMPKLDGIATVLKLKSIEATRSTPVIICTGVKEGEDEIVAKNLGVADYFKKSESFDDLITKIEKILKK